MVRRYRCPNGAQAKADNILGSGCTAVLKSKLIKSRFLQKVIIVCILLGTIPSIMVGAFSYRKSSETIQRKVDEGCISQLEQVQLSVELQLAATKKVLIQLFESPSVTQSIQTEKSGLKFESFLRMENAIDSLPSTNLPIYNVSLINVGKNWAVDKTNIYDLSSYEQMNPSVTSYIKATQRSFWNDDSRVLDSSGNLLVNCVSAVQKYKNSEGNFIGTIDIPYSNLKSLIKTEASGIIMIVNAKNELIYSDQPKSSSGFSASMITLIHRNGKKSGNLNLKLNNSAWNITYIRSDYNQWYYVLATPMDEIVRDSRTIQWFTFFVCAALIVLIVLASIFISGRVYRPVQYLSAVLSEESAPSSAQHPASDEVQQIETRVFSLITDRSKLKREIVFQSQKLREYFVSKLLASHSSSDFMKEKAVQYGLPGHPPMMAVMVIQPDPFDENTPYQESDDDILLYAISNIAEEIFSGHAVILTSMMDNRQVTILSVEGMEYKDASYSYASQIQKTLQDHLKLGTSVIISRPANRYEDLRGNYQECIHILQYSLLSRGSITFAEDINKHYDFNYVYPQDLEAEIMDAVKTCDRARGKELIHQFLDAVFNIQANHCVYKIFLLRITANLIILGNHGNADLCRCESEYIRRIYNMRDREQIENWLQDTVAESVIQSIEKSKDNHLRQICNSVLDIIHSEYSNKLTLEACAQKLNYHPSYIRRVLKKEMGINFRDYLLHYQMNVAKKQLIETEDSVSDIAQELQYENTENFIRSFKKTVGCTPRQYREHRNTL